MAAKKIPIPIHESIANENGRATPALVRYLNELSNIGIGAMQTWQNVASSRALGTTYTNDTGKPIQVTVSVVGKVNIVNTATVNSIIISRQYITTAITSTHSFIVPIGGSYVISSTQTTLVGWTELR